MTWPESDITLLLPQAHRVEVRTQGGAITCGGTIHGNVDISATGDGVRLVHEL